MQQAADPATTAGSFVTLRARGSRLSVRPGCLSAFGGPVLALGLWLIGIAILIQPGGVSPRWLVIAGGVIAATGLFVLLMRMRQTAGAFAPVPEVALESGHQLTPGAIVPLRLRLQATARLERLKVTLVSDRRYQEQITTPGSVSLSPIERVETLATQDLLEVTNLSLNRRIPWERMSSLVVPYLAKPSGPVLPAGAAEWYLDVLVQPAVGTAVHDRYDLVVVLSDAPETAPQPAAQDAGQTGRRATTIVDLIPPSVGCAVIPLGFLFCGTVLLWLYFGGATTSRGNPVMGLIAGIVFSLLGILGLTGLVSGRRNKPRRFGRNDPRRLP